NPGRMVVDFYDTSETTEPRTMRQGHQRGSAFKIMVVNSGYLWESSYRAAILETDNPLLPARIAQAKQELMKRLHSLTTKAEDEEELLAVEGALRNLAVLEKKRQNGLE